MALPDDQLYGVWNDTKDRWTMTYLTGSKEEMDKFCRSLNASLEPQSFSVRSVADQNRRQQHADKYL